MNKALLLNGVYEYVLIEILRAQDKSENLKCYLQPYTTEKIKLLAEETPSLENPITLYISTTATFNYISYIAKITSWADKRDLKDAQYETLNSYIKKYQPGEKEAYPYSSDKQKAKNKKCVNLIGINSLKQLINPFSITNLKKCSDNEYCKIRGRSGGHSVVYEIPNLIKLKTSMFFENYQNDLDTNISKSLNDTREKRLSRLQEASKIPEQIQIISKGFKRNSDVIVEVLRRAKGKCEYCNSSAPFIRKKDNTPYLEIHHKKTLADNGEDSIENTIAVCPNCHKYLHFGK